MREIFGKWITEIAKKDDSVYLIVGDFGYGVLDDFRKKFPDRFINIGLCEQSMIGIAAGMSLLGLKPYVFTITPFALELPYESIKLDVVANQANVKIISFWDYPTQGITHLTKNPRELCNLLEIKYREPKNSNECRCMLDDAYNNDKPYFLYLTKDDNI